jgi:hypothetical protein
VLRIVRAVQRAAGQLQFVDPKTPRARRVPPVPQVATVLPDRLHAAASAMDRAMETR